MKIIAYRIDHELELIHETLKGQISSEEFIEFQKSIIEDPEYNASYSIISDIRDSFYDFSDESTKHVYIEMRELSKKYNSGCKCAFVTHKPLEVVRSYLFQKEMQNYSPVEYKTFSTLEGAMLWLEVSADVFLSEKINKNILTF